MLNKNIIVIIKLKKRKEKPCVFYTKNRTNERSEFLKVLSVEDIFESFARFERWCF